jgi:SAM-dependent methyltransferase
VTGAGSSWEEGLADRFVGHHYGSLRGHVRTHVIHRHLLDHLPPPPLTVVDVGGGAGHQSFPLAAAGYDVTIVDPSPRMLALADERRAGSDRDLAARVRLVEAAGEAAPGVLGGERFGAVLCHGVFMYLDDPAPMVGALADLAAPAGLVSIVAKNRSVMAVRPALEGDWAAALAALRDGYDHRQINGLGVETRGDDVDGLGALLRARSVEPLAWYGVRLFSDGWVRGRPAADPTDLVLAVELEASRRDPYRQMSRLFHLLGRRA